MPLNFYYCKGDGFHAVIEEQNEKFATEYFVYLMNEILEPEKGISEKDVVCEHVNVYNYSRRPTKRVPDVCQVCGSGWIPWDEVLDPDLCAICGTRR